MHEAVSILVILPHRLRCDLNVTSSIAPDAKISLSQDSVSAHSLRAISNLECISARLWGYCASVILAKTLDEDFLIWKTVLESILYSLQSLAILTANSSLYSKSKLRFLIALLRTKSDRRSAWNRSHSERMESVKNGMESTRSVAWNQDRRVREDPLRGMPYTDEPQCHTTPKALIPCQALRSWIKNPRSKERGFFWWPVRESNPCYSRERAVS